MRNQRLPPTTGTSSKSNTMQEDQPHLSGAYIRRLVKHLSSSSTKRSKDHHHTITTMGTNPHVQPQQQEQQAAPQTPKKQVRRRLHTSRPYQERLLNMAEARREIVTALKIHRASMRQAKEQQQQQQLVQHQQEVQVVQEQIRQAAWSAPMGSYGLSLSDYLHDSSPSVEFSGTSSSCSYYSSPILPAYHTPPVVAAPLVPMVDGPLDHFLSLPAQPLGLNLSFHGFGGAVAAGEDDKSDPTGSFHPPPMLQPSPASSYSVYSSPPPAMTMASHDAVTSAENTSLHRVLDDEEMAAICSAGEQHDIEWSDTVNLVTSAWWSTLLESVEGSGDAAVAPQTNAGDALGMHRTDENCGSDVSSLPRMDIGEMDGWDAEWFS